MATVAVLVAGVRLTHLADRLADLTGLGEALTGAVFLGAVTSISGAVASTVAAVQGHPELAVANALGGIAAQTAFLVIADLTYRRANLEHAAASLGNMFSGCLLIVLLNVILIARQVPAVTVLGVHPLTFVLFAAYGMGMRMGAHLKENPMWGPTDTPETRIDVPDEPAGDRTRIGGVAAMVVLLGAVTGLAGFVIAESAVALSARARVDEGVVGALLTAVATSTPELVTTVAAVRRGALTLAVGGILGGNTFDVLFVAFADLGYRDGSIYHDVTDAQAYLIVLTTLMTGVLLLGLLRRQRHGIANIGFESVVLLLLYLAGMAVYVTRVAG